MSREAVGFDDELGLGPREVDFVGVDLRVDLRAGEAVAVDDGQEAFFEPAFRHFRWARCRLQELGAASAWVVLNYGCKGGHVEEAQVFGFVDCSPEVLEGQGVGEVEQGSGKGRDGNTFMNGDLVGAEPARAVHPDALPLHPPVLSRHRHVDDGRGTGADSPQGRGVGMRQDGSRPARQHRSRPVALAPQHGVADRVHAAVQAMKTTGPNPLCDPAVPDTQTPQLFSANNAVLAPSERRQAPVHRG